MELVITDKGIRYNVTVTNDYHIKGSFDPDAPSDLDYYGYRDTELEVTSVSVMWHTGDKAYMWVPMLDDEVDAHVESNIDKITLLVQDAIDIMEEDAA